MFISPSGSLVSSLASGVGVGNEDLLPRAKTRIILRCANERGIIRKPKDATIKTTVVEPLVRRRVGENQTDPIVEAVKSALS